MTFKIRIPKLQLHDYFHSPDHHLSTIRKFRPGKNLNPWPHELQSTFLTTRAFRPELLSLANGARDQFHIKILGGTHSIRLKYNLFWLVNYCLVYGYLPNRYFKSCAPAAWSWSTCCRYLFCISQKTFDTLGFAKLLTKLPIYGVWLTLLRWLYSF